ncbi:MAG: hypothetical protein HQK53_13535 [Oligoflexia bacterium]|nr:hypothetical protein [Oligoflexia bacterium]
MKKEEDDSDQAAIDAAWTNKIFPIAMSISIAASSWFLNQAWTKISTLEAKVQAIEVSVAATSGNRFSSNDWVTAKSLLDTERTALDRRIMRLEESLPVIKDSLLEIKDKLSDK